MSIKLTKILIITEGDVNKINEGVVISDEAENEFVWVPCTEEQYKKHEYTALSEGETDEGNNVADGSAHDQGWNTRSYKSYSDWTDENAEENKASIEKYGGLLYGKM